MGRSARSPWQQWWKHLNLSQPVLHSLQDLLLAEESEAREFLDVVGGEDAVPRPHVAVERTRLVTSGLTQ